MSVWTAIKNFGPGAILTEADMDTYVSQNTNYLKDLSDTSLQFLNRLTSVTTVVNTTVETTMFSYSVPGGTLGTTHALKFSGVGDFGNNSGTTSYQFVLRIKYGATTIAQHVFANLNTGNFTQPLTIDAELHAYTATNAQRARSHVGFDGIAHGDANSGIAITRDFAGGSGGGITLGTASGLPTFSVHNGVAEDSTAAKNFTVTFQFSGTDATLQARLWSAYLIKI
jgi:hypothetical protein